MKIQKSTLTFLKELSKNNTKEWFLENKNQYEAAKENFLAFCESLLEKLEIVDEDLKGLEAKKCIFRLHRDVRFSKDKSPYKTNFGAAFSKGGKKQMMAAYYIHLEPNQCFIGGGIWLPEASVLSKIRQEILYNYKDFEKILKDKKFTSTYLDLDRDHSLKRAPKGIDETHPGIDLLKLTSYTCSKKLSEKEILDEQLIKNMTADFKTIKPFIHFLNRSLD